MMLGTYASMHDLILYFSFNQKMFLGSENIWESMHTTSITLDTFSYYFLFNVPGIFIYWIYELLHTYFVVTLQFSAFFAISFWLYLFFYTFFVAEKQENYLTEKRLFRSNYFKHIYNLKK
jgi:apolipoprotein N-acyltransferase